MTGPATDSSEPAEGAAPTTEPPPPEGASLVIWLLVASAFVMILNETIMSVALPALIAGLHISVGTAQ